MDEAIKQPDEQEEPKNTEEALARLAMLINKLEALKPKMNRKQRRIVEAEYRRFRKHQAKGTLPKNPSEVFTPVFDEE